MKIELIAVGTRAPDWVTAGFAEYQKRMPRECELTLNEVSVAKRKSNTSVAQLKEMEGAQMLDRIKPRSHVVALDVKGKGWSTEQLADKLKRWMSEAPSVSLLVGGPDGLSEGCMARADESWSLSALTFPHFLVRVILAEQLYRAVSIINNHPYHRE